MVTTTTHSSVAVVMRKRRRTMTATTTTNSGMVFLLPLLLLAIWSSLNGSIGSVHSNSNSNNKNDNSDAHSRSFSRQYVLVDAFSLSSPSASASVSLQSRDFQQMCKNHRSFERTRRLLNPRLGIASTSTSTSTTTTKVSATATTTTTTTTNNPDPPQNDTDTNKNTDRLVEVWDGVFSAEVCEYLHELAIDHSERTTSEEGDYYDEDEDEDDDEEYDDDDEEEEEEEEEYYDDDEEEEEDDSLDGSSVFVHHRNRNKREQQQQQQQQHDPLTPLEHALNSFLGAYYDSHPEEAPNKDVVVEYWCRQEHLNLEAHADVDEVWFERWCKKHKKDGDVDIDDDDAKAFRYPTFGHVLYLTKPTLGRGPTCVFPPLQDKGKNNNKRNSDSTTCIADEITSVVTIPSVPGRVLRFPGNAVHAVPKPADVWFSAGGNESNDDNEDDWDGDDNDDDNDDERSVVLFNTWYASEDEEGADAGADADAGAAANNSCTTIGQGPIGVHRDPMFHAESDAELVEMMMSSADIADSGVEVDEAFVKGMVDYAKQQKADQLQNWRDKFGASSDDDDDETAPAAVIYSRVCCQPRDAWKLAPIRDSGGRDCDCDAGNTNTNTTDDETATAIVDGGAVAVATIRVPLMGDARRRRYPTKIIRWTVPTSFQRGVNDPERPFRFPVQPSTVTTQSRNNC